MNEKAYNQAPIDLKGDEYPFALKLTLPDAILLALSVIFIIISVIAVFIEYGNPDIFTIMHGVHFQLSRYGLVVGLVMLMLSIYIGIYRKGDVTAWFRRGSYVIFGTKFIQAILGAVMMFGYNVKPGAPEHLIYGAGTVLTLPFFIFVETTAKKRPAMGSYIWGFALLVGVVLRSIATGRIY
ncbi:MAG TPA: hypothetical protein VHL11_01205 [Phototrophicaceae bacterium]|nr:hypothetical protein [Phototrophicaceae bacterium]